MGEVDKTVAGCFVINTVRYSHKLMGNENEEKTKTVYSKTACYRTSAFRCFMIILQSTHQY